jgi:predicted GIY-YIG superfamily endonuclease
MAYVPGPRKRWSDQEILDYAKKFQTIKEWAADRPTGNKTYNSSVRRGKSFHEKATTHMFVTKWRRDSDIIEDAKKYTTRYEWSLKSPGAYIAARKRNNVDLFKRAVLHMGASKQFAIRKWTEKAILKESLKFKTKKEWAVNSASSYGAALKQGLMDKASKHFDKVGNHKNRCVYLFLFKKEKIAYVGLTYYFKRRVSNHLGTKRFKDLIKLYGRRALTIKQVTDYVPVEAAKRLEKQLVEKYRSLNFRILNIAKTGSVGGNTVKWTREVVKLKALEFNNSKEWKKNCPGSYAAGAGFDMLDIATSHMTRLVRKKWESKIEVMQEAKKYTTRTEWDDKSGAAVAYAKKHGFYEEAAKHMPDKRNSKWDHESAIFDGKKYKNRGQWSGARGSAYYYASKNNLLDLVFPSKNKKLFQKL